jgi:hypothetical protein
MMILIATALYGNEVSYLRRIRVVNFGYLKIGIKNRMDNSFF